MQQTELWQIGDAGIFRRAGLMVCVEASLSATRSKINNGAARSAPVLAAPEGLGGVHWQADGRVMLRR